MAKAPWSGRRRAPGFHYDAVIELRRCERTPRRAYFDAETGLHQNWHRDYSPATGRYLQSDPIGLAAGPSTYGYSLQNPVNVFDPTGLVSYCTAPLKALPQGDFGGLGPLHHAFLCDNSGTVCGGQDRQGNGFFSPGRPSEDDAYNSERCETVSNDECLNECVKEEVNSSERPPYTFFYNPGGALLGAFGAPLPQNCQDWARATLLKCRVKCAFK